MFLPDYQPSDDNDIFQLKGSEEEQKFIRAVVQQVEGLIIATTFKLQLELDQQDEMQIIASMIAAKFKCNETLTVTEATALVINDITPSSQNNMELHIKNLINNAVNKKICH
jgi:hypothetical protein